MQNKINYKLWALAAILASALLLPAMGQAREENWSSYREWKTKLAKELKLSPEKEAKFVAVADKYANLRQQIYESLKKSQGELATAVAAGKPDEAKVKQLVKSITEAQDQLLTVYKVERDDEMALLSPMQQGQYLVILHQWRQQMHEKHGMQPKMEQGKK